MTTLKVTFAVASTITGPVPGVGSPGTVTTSDSKYLQDANMPSLGLLIGRMDFFDRDGGAYNEVSIISLPDGWRNYNYLVLVRGTADSSSTSYYPVPHSEKNNGDSTWSTDIDLPQAAVNVLKLCKYVNYNFTTATMNGVDYNDTIFTPPSTYRSEGYAWISYTASTFHAKIVGDTNDFMDFGLTVPNPYPSYYFNTWTSPLVFTVTPDIFWTNRYLCEET